MLELKTFLRLLWILFDFRVSYIILLCYDCTLWFSNNFIRVDGLTIVMVCRGSTEVEYIISMLCV